MSEINPQMAQALEIMRGQTKLREGQIPSGMEEVRKNANADFAYWNEDPPALYRVTDLELPGAFGPRTVRHYQPEESTTPRPALIHFHGGGWIVGDLDLEDRFLRELSLASTFDILSVDYVLAPEHQFPAPLDDCVAVSQSIVQSANQLGLDEQRIGLSGSSAGANLALATALSTKDKLAFKQILLFYGVFDAAMTSASHDEFSEGEFSPGGPGMELFLQRYLPDQNLRSDPLVSPVLANLQGLPACYLCIAELDALRDDSILLRRKLIEAGVNTTSQIYPGMIHGFTLMSRMVDVAGVAINDAGEYLREQF